MDDPRVAPTPDDGLCGGGVTTKHAESCQAWETVSRTDADLEAARKILKVTQSRLRRLRDTYVDGRMEQGFGRYSLPFYEFCPVRVTGVANGNGKPCPAIPYGPKWAVLRGQAMYPGRFRTRAQ